MQKNYLYKTLVICLFLFILLPACKKNDGPAGNSNNNAQAKSINDSIFFITKDIYLWTDALPDSTTFKPNSFSTTTAMFDSLITYKKNSSGGNLDRYSFLDDGSTSRALQQGIVGDMGFEVGWETNTTLYVVYVYPGSPADQAGIKRGWQLTGVNGTTSFQYGNASNNLLNQALGASSASFSFLKPDSSSQQITLSATDYKLNPVLYSHLYDFNGTKIGYFVFNNFVALEDVQSQIDSIFNAFSKAGVQQVIIDLRYNGGGIVQTAEYLANLLVPASKTNTLMYTQTYNNNVLTNNYSAYFKGMKAVPYYPTTNWTDIFYSEATTYKNTNFQKTGALNLSKVSFLVTGNTVSASELLYNVLKPAMTTKLIGQTTYGKPVGFINITFSQYDMYAVCFQSRNSAGEGDYFTGLTPDISEYDDYTSDWGDLRDPLLHAALLDMGIPASSLGRSAKAFLNNRIISTPANRLQATRFKGMIQTFKR
ncbi:S41 family peptidase [Chitinophaga sp. 30R24]|uniref:S41 family peptidase n=1 Tax=Chitinophaga sp. 30R24 TaxID=3248838 RepID=UPI003B8FBE3E